MGREVERKFLIRENGIDYATEQFFRLYKSIDLLERDVLLSGVSVRQGYLPDAETLSRTPGFESDFKPAEARLREKGKNFYFTLKSEGGVERQEFEREIDLSMFSRYWPATLGSRVEKVRLETKVQGGVLLYDVYQDRDLIVAEIEASREIADSFGALGLDVSEMPKYKNRALAR